MLLKMFFNNLLKVSALTIGSCFESSLPAMRSMPGTDTISIDTGYNFNSFSSHDSNSI